MSIVPEADKSGVDARRKGWMPPDIVQFTIKTCVVAVVISACTIFVIDWIVSDLQDLALQTIASVRDQIAGVRDQIDHTTIGGEKFWTKVEHELDRAADPKSDLPPQEKQKLINDVRVIVARWRPFVDAAQDELQKPRSN